jgi:FkbM family methyltransferase
VGVRANVADSLVLRWFNDRLHRLLDGIVAPDASLRRWISPAYSAWLRLLSGGRGYPASINGQVFRIDPRFRWAANADVERGVAEYLAARVKPGDCCFDVGANVGVYVLQLSRWSAPNGRIAAFEPNPATVDVLRAHVRMNGLDDRVTIIPMAAGATRGTARLFDTEPGSGLSRLGGAHPGIKAALSPTDVQVTTVDEFCQSSGLVPDWMIIDVEGYEYEVLQGAAATLRRHKPHVVVELHDHVLSEASRQAGMRLLADLGLTPVSIPKAAEGRSESFVTLEANDPRPASGPRE